MVDYFKTDMTTTEFKDIYDPGTAKVGIIILGAGKGKRMESDLPKVLVPLYGQPLISHVLHSIESVTADARPILVVGYKAELVKETLGPNYRYAIQTEQLGTGHAVMAAREVAAEYDHIVVLYGDQPHIPAQVINELIATHLQERATMTLMTVTVPDFDKWRAALATYGRIVRNDAGDILGIVEKKDATPEQLLIREVNPSFFCFRASWLWEQLPLLKNKNAQGEYYLTDLVSAAVSNGDKIASFSGDALAALGANTKEELRLLEQILEGVTG